MGQTWSVLNDQFTCWRPVKDKAVRGARGVHLLLRFDGNVVLVKDTLTKPPAFYPPIIQVKSGSTCLAGFTDALRVCPYLHGLSEEQAKLLQRSTRLWRFDSDTFCLVCDEIHVDKEWLKNMEDSSDIILKPMSFLVKFEPPLGDVTYPTVPLHWIQLLNKINDNEK